MLRFENETDLWARDYSNQKFKRRSRTTKENAVHKSKCSDRILVTIGKTIFLIHYNKCLNTFKCISNLVQLDKKVS